MRKHITISNLKKEGNVKMRKLSLVFVLTCVALLAMTSMAFAAHSYSAGDGFALQGDKITQQTWFDPDRSAAGGCNACHGLENISTNERGAYGSGPHGGYTENSGKCTTCHTIHTGAYGMDAKKATNSTLLPGNTVTAVCNYCHDLTGTPLAPYSTRYLYEQGVPGTGVNSGHFVEGATPTKGIESIRSGDGWSVTNAAYVFMDMPGTVIPGGDSTTGGTVTILANLFNKGSEFNTTQGGSAIFTCNSCHTPHAVNGSTVNPYFGESERIDLHAESATSRLLKKNLIGTTQNIADYGSEWCAGCHQGRNTMLASGNYNHPVNASGLGYLTPAVLNAAIAGGFANDVTGKDLAADANAVWDGTTDGYEAARTNAWYAMTDIDPIGGANRDTADGNIRIGFWAANGGPSCQQCHASARNVEGSIAAASQFAPVGTAVYTGKPITTFPHVSRTKNLLVEDGDDLCTNCHGLADLP